MKQEPDRPETEPTKSAKKKPDQPTKPVKQEAKVKTEPASGEWKHGWECEWCHAHPCASMRSP